VNKGASWSTHVFPRLRYAPLASSKPASPRLGFSTLAGGPTPEGWGAPDPQGDSIQSRPSAPTGLDVQKTRDDAIVSPFTDQAAEASDFGFFDLGYCFTAGPFPANRQQQVVKERLHCTGEQLGYLASFISFNIGGRRFPRRLNATVPSPGVYGRTPSGFRNPSNTTSSRVSRNRGLRPRRSASCNLARAEFMSPMA